MDHMTLTSKRAIFLETHAFVISYDNMLTYVPMNQSFIYVINIPGTRTDYLQVSLSEGGLSVLVVLGSGSTEIEVKPRRRFDDNRWHHVIITRDARELTRNRGICEVSVVVNNHWEKTGTATGSFTMLTSDLLFVGGPPDDGSALSSRLAPSFRGCLKEVLYTADSIRLDLLNLARNQHDLLKVTGDLLFDQCEDLAESQPITFLTEESFLESVTWDLSKGGSLSLKFRTNEPNGLLVYSLGAPLSGVYFAVEILDDLLYVTVVTESGLIQKIPAIHGSSVSDGNPHDLRIKINGSLIVVSVDQRRTRVDLSGHSSELSFVTPLVFGGLSPMSAQHAPIQMWSAMLGYGYVGCLQDVEVNGLKIVLADLARDQQAEGVVEYCRTEPAECPDYPCMHRGKCRDGWNRYVCDCTATAYSGESCNDVAVSLGFDGSQFMEIPLPEESTSEVEDISLRFRTERADGLLFATLSNSSVDRLEVMLDAGQLRMDINLGTGTKTLLAGSNLDNSAWHWLQIRRRAGQIELQVDNETTVKDYLDADMDWALSHDRILVASLATHPPPYDIEADSKKKKAFMRSGAKFIDFDQLRLAKRPTRDVSHLRSKRNFIGDMSQFLFNKNDFFEMARAGGIENLRTNARIDKREALVNSPITFLSPAAYLTTKLKLYSTFTIYFSLKTTQPDGLIMYSGSGITGKDFLTIEMVNGHLRYVYDVGSGPRVVRSKYKGPLNDNDWHHVAILRPTLNQHILRVDDTAAHDHLPNFSSVHFDMGDHFYVGGLDKTMYDSLPKQVKSREGFLGCVASLDLDGNQNIMEHRANIPDEFRDAVSSGCEGPTTQCTDTSCDNGGLCVQEWNTYSCECDRTSFTGPTCSDDGIAYTFEGGGGLIAYTFPEDDQPSTKRDVISLGFSTAQKDAVLVRVNGATNDYIEMELVDGNIFVVYNMGTMDHPIGELFERVNDDQYHVVRFTRNGPNSTIQIDDLQVQTKTPTGRHMNVFNNQATVHIGGKKSSGQLMRPFKGTIAGLVLNGEKILELAAEGDPSVKIEGDVELEIKPLRPHYSLTPLPPTRPVIITPAPGEDETNTSDMQSTMRAKTTPQGEGPGDDIVFSGVESGCHFEDEEECVHGSGASTQDALIRPVSDSRGASPSSHQVTPTPKSTLSTDPSPLVESSGDNPCEGDDEDCETVSGGESGFPPVEVRPSTPDTSTDDIGFPDTPEPPPSRRPPPATTTTTAASPIPSRRPTPDDIDFPDAPSHRPDEGIVRPEQRTPSTAESHTPHAPISSSTKDSLFVFVNITTEAPKKTGGNSGTSSAGGGGSNVNQSKDNKRKHNSLPMNIGLIVGIAAAVVVLFLVLAYALYKYRSRDEGSYKIDETKNYSYETCNTKPPPPVNGERSSSKQRGQATKPRKKDVKEWYV